MGKKPFAIRVCSTCGLRYPVLEGNKVGTRCPNCLGSTKVIIKKTAEKESSNVRREAQRDQWVVLLDNIRSAWNVGSILRSADGFGYSHAYLCGITPTPEEDAVRKTSLNAEDFVTWSYHKDAVKLVKGLRIEGWKIVSLENEERAFPVEEKALSLRPFPTVLVVGNELTGVDPGLLNYSDEIIYLPMRGAKQSFNVAVAFGIAAYAMSRSG